MGWCQDFAVEIRPGCDHRMVAHHHSCFCEACETQCLGRFAGCAGVWERGPVPIDLRRPQANPPGWWRASGQATEDVPDGPDPDAAPPFEPARSWAPAPPPRRADGNTVRLVPNDPVSAAPGEAPLAAQGVPPGRGASSHLVDLLEALTEEIRALQDQVDRLEDRAEVAEDLARTALEATRDAQLHIRRAIQEQHGAIVNDLGRLRTQVTRQAEHDRGSFFRSDTDAVMAHLDARLDWLLNELASRLVVLGNQVAISGRQLRDARPTPGGQPSAPT